MIDLNEHPLAQFFRLVAVEYARGLAKYGPWSEIEDTEQAGAIRGEFCEWTAAYYGYDILGDHGELAELPQLANVAGRRWMELTRRKNEQSTGED